MAPTGAAATIRAVARRAREVKPKKSSTSYGIRKLASNGTKGTFKYMFRGEVRKVCDGEVTTTGSVIRKDPFQRLVDQIMDELSIEGIRFSQSACDALRDLAEPFLVRFFDLANSCALLNKRFTLQPQDMTMARMFFRAEAQKQAEKL